jgi:uncharacterized protein YgiM (DUF1202 family)
MKQLILSFALFVQFGFVMAQANKPGMLVQAKYDNAKVFQQAGTSTAVIETLTTTDQVELIRRWNSHWALVKVNGKVGYMVYSELTYRKAKAQPEPRTLAAR